MTTRATFHHEALFYAGDEEFVERCRAFALDGLDHDEPVLLMVGSRKLELLREALGGRADEARFADMEVVGRNPARIIPAWGRFVAANSQGAACGPMRGIGEPIWADRKPDELVECQLHESLLNLAFAAAEFQLICPYDTTALPDHVIAEARRSHPIVSATGVPEVCGDYCGLENVAALFYEDLAEPPADADELRVTLDGLREARGLVRRHAEDAGLGERADDFVLAVNEVLSNSLYHAHDDGSLRIWNEPDALVCEVRDSGWISRPLIGREEPAAGQVGGHGIWLVNLVCDLVQVRSSEHGSTVRMRMTHA